MDWNARLETTLRRAVAAIPTLALATILWTPPTALADDTQGISKGQLRTLSAAWWQWAVSIPADVNPLAVDDVGSGDYCGVGQHGKVWFLGGSFVSAEAERECTVPAGSQIFFPVANALCSVIFQTDGDTEEELRDCAAFLVDAVTELDASVDGVPLNDLWQSRVQSPLFSVAVPPGDAFSLYGLYPNPSPSAADGYYVLLKPLSVGDHEIDFHAKFVFPDLSEFELTIEYDVEIVPLALN